MRGTGWLLVVWIGLVGFFTPCHAHLVMAQRGTLNLVDSGAYMVLSLPASAFDGIDDNGDGLFTLDELRHHAPRIHAQVQQGVMLRSGANSYPLEGIMLNTVPPDNNPQGGSNQVLVLGRFAVPPNAPDVHGLQFHLRLFGKQGAEQVQQITVSRGEETQLMTLSPERQESDVLPTAWNVFLMQIHLGAEHVLSGADHLLFLLVVLASGWSLRAVVWALTSFTIGHAITLAACVLGGFSAPSALVEPAIAATIVGMAWFDRWALGKNLTHPHITRVLLVMACALIHGLGLAGALTDLGIDPQRRGLSLLGFNIGIEIAQLGVALAAAGLLQVFERLRGKALEAVQIARMAEWTSYVALFIGSFWFVERVMAAVREL